mmetsp:Transcript_20062/g.30843  ORF Transcript_20062/g.30843 Transcript_20062/m.30843 type:complete len:92 (+) Transcript_20062:699-974(+)
MLPPNYEQNKMDAQAQQTEAIQKVKEDVKQINMIQNSQQRSISSPAMLDHEVQPKSEPTTASPIPVQAQNEQSPQNKTTTVQKAAGDGQSP